MTARFKRARTSIAPSSRMRRGIFLSLAALLLSSACASDSSGDQTGDQTGDQPVASGDLDELIAAAQAEGALTYYSANMDAINTAVTEAFTDEYGIPVEVLRLGTGDMVERFAGEMQADAGNADLLEVATPTIFEEQPQWFETLSTDLVPGLADYPEGTGWTESSMTVAIGGIGIQYNTDLVEEPPETWADMLDPKWADQALWTDTRCCPVYSGWLDIIRQELGDDYLEGMAENVASLVDSAGPGAQQVAAGAYPINLPAAASSPQSLMAEGAPIDIVIPQDVVTGSPQLMNIVAGAEHPNAAALFMHFRTLVETQNLVCGIATYYSPLKDATDCEPLPDNFIPVSFDVFEDKARVSENNALLGIE